MGTRPHRPLVGVAAVVTGLALLLWPAGPSSPAEGATPSWPPLVQSLDASEAEGIVTGTVRSGGAPVVGATVWFGKDARPPALALSRSQGEFELRGAPPGEAISVWASRGSRVVGLRVAPAARRRLVLELAPAGSLRVRVKRPDGGPGADAGVEVSNHVRDGGAWFSTTTSTSRQGEAFFPAIAPGEYFVSIPTGRMHRFQEHKQVEEGRETLIEFTVPERGKIEGRVVNARGRGVENVKLDAELAEDGGWDYVAAFHTATSGEDGVFEIDDLEGRSYDLVVREPGVGAARLTVAAPAAGVTVKLSPGAMISGRVDDSRGAVEGFKLELFHPITQMMSQPIARTRTNVNGEYSFPEVPEGSYLLVAEAPSGADGRGQQRVVTVPPAAARVETSFVFGEGGSIGGVAVDGEGKPLSEVMVGLRVPGAPFANAPEMTTGPDGRFSFDRLSEPGYQVSALKSGYLTWTDGKIATGNLAVKAVLLAHGKVRGRMLDGKRKPVERFRISGVEFDAPGGRFEFKLESSARQPVDIALPGLGSSIHLLEGKMGATTELGDLVITRLPQVTVTVMDGATRKPMPEMGLWYIYKKSATSRVAIKLDGQYGLTDEKGQLTLPGVAIGSVEVGCAWLACPFDGVAVPPGVTAVTLVVKGPRPKAR